MRKKKAVKNIIISLLLELITVISGLIVPRLFIGQFGSETNGLINSITSFVGYITLLQLGVGSVVKASLYSPLAKQSHDELCVIVKTSETFFRRIAIATVVYLGILMVIFPSFIAPDFGWLYTASLVIIVGLSTAAQYFFGITYQMLLEADQRSYVYSCAQIISVILNTVVAVILIKLNCSVQIVKFASAIIYVLRPLALNFYTKRHYKIHTDVQPNNELIKQRWDGFVQAIAYFIHSKTDIFVLTVFSTLSNVSVYSVYTMVTAGLSSLINAIDKAVRSAFGNIIALDERENLIKSFNAYNALIHMLSTVLFATASISVFSFVSVYVKNIADADYHQPLFGVLIITAEYLYCLRTPYNSIVYAAGKFKETKVPAGIEAIINIVISLGLVRHYGLVGVALGTLNAMAYRTVSFILFLHKDVLFLRYFTQIKRYFVSFLSYGLSLFLLSKIKFNTENYFQWILYAGMIFVLTGIITFVVNLVLNYTDTKSAIKMLIRRKR